MRLDVMFIRVTAQPAVEVTRILQNFYEEGWRVVSHSDSDGEYSFVLEQIEVTTWVGAVATPSKKGKADPSRIKGGA